MYSRISKLQYMCERAELNIFATGVSLRIFILSYWKCVMLNQTRLIGAGEGS